MGNANVSSWKLLIVAPIWDSPLPKNKEESASSPLLYMDIYSSLATDDHFGLTCHVSFVAGTEDLAVDGSALDVHVGVTYHL